MDDGKSAMGKRNQAKFVSIPSLTGVQAGKLMGWVYAPKAGWTRKQELGQAPYEKIIEFAAGPCCCEERKALQADWAKYKADLAEYQRKVSQSESGQTVSGRMTELNDIPARPPRLATPFDAPECDDSSALRNALAHLFIDDDRVAWQVNPANGEKVAMEAAICHTCLLKQLFQVYADAIFPAIMPTVPQFLKDSQVTFDSAEGKRLIENYKRSAFGFRLLFASLFGWQNMTPYMHIVGVHSAEFLMQFGSCGLYSQGAFEAAHKIFRTHTSHTTHDGGRDNRSKLTRDLMSQDHQDDDSRAPNNCDNR